MKKRIYRRLIVSAMLAGMLTLTGCLFGPPGTPPGTPAALTFVADQLVGPPNLADGGFKVTFSAAGGTGTYVIDFGDGAVGVPSSSISHTYTKVGGYVATCTSGTETAVLNVVVENSPCGVLYEPYIESPATDCDEEDPWRPWGPCDGCDDDPYEDCDLWMCERAILDGLYHTTGTVKDGDRKFYGQEVCCGYDHTYYWDITLTSVCAVHDLPLEVWGEGPTVVWYIGNEDPWWDFEYPVLTSEGEVGPLNHTMWPWWPPDPPDLDELPYGPRVALAYITLTVVDQFGSHQSITIERWVCTCDGCDTSPCPGNGDD